MLRGLRRSPAQVAAVTLSLGVGLAPCVAAFSAVDVLVFRPLPGVVAMRDE